MIVTRSSRARHRRPDASRRIRARALALAPVAGVLLLQAVLSIRLLHVSGASGDESLYIYSGHQLIHELWHGGGSPYYETYFSGAPVIYPVLAAMLDHAGGLALVRLVSGGFMLAATGLLFATARRLFGYWPAVTAIGLFASLGITQGLGAYATFDAMALMLMAFAAYCAVRAPDGSKWLLFIPAILLVANATKYACVLFDPVVIMLAALALRSQGWARVTQRAAALGVATASLIAIAVTLAGTSYVKGILFTTIARKTGTGILNLNPSNPMGIVRFSWNLIGLVVLLGALAVVVAMLIPKERPVFAVLLLFVVAGSLVTLEAVHLRDLTSVNKHDDFGVWFTVMAAGYLLARGAELVRSWWARAMWILPALAVVGITLHLYTNLQPIDGSPNMHGTKLLVPYLQADSNYNYLIGGRINDSIMYHYHLAIPWYRDFDDNYVKYPVPGRGGDRSGSVPGLTCTSPGPKCVYVAGPAGAEAAIRAHWFAVVSFVGQNYLPIDKAELEAVQTTPGYELVSTPGGQTYVYAPDYPGLAPKMTSPTHHARRPHRKHRAHRLSTIPSGETRSDLPKGS
jgi:Dolichyl-phosphate-mannose-protein mannosyltransferase